MHLFLNMRRRQWHPTPVLLPGKSHGRRSLEGCSAWGRWGSDTTERLHFHFSLSCIGEGNGNPFQCSCLENPKDGGAWWAAVSGVAQSRTRLKQLSSSSNTSKVMLKILQTRLQQYVNCELLDVQAGFRKGRGTRDQIASIRWMTEKAREFQKKHLLLLYWLCQSLWMCGSPQTVENSERDGNTRPPDLPLEKPICRSGSNS